MLLFPVFVTEVVPDCRPHVMNLGALKPATAIFPSTWAPLHEESGGLIANSAFDGASATHIPLIPNPIPAARFKLATRMGVPQGSPLNGLNRLTSLLPELATAINWSGSNCPPLLE